MKIPRCPRCRHPKPTVQRITPSNSFACGCEWTAGKRRSEGYHVSKSPGTAHLTRDTIAVNWYLCNSKEGPAHILRYVGPFLFMMNLGLIAAVALVVLKTLWLENWRYLIGEKDEQHPGGPEPQPDSLHHANVKPA